MATRIRYEKHDDPKGKFDQVSVRNFHSSKYIKHEDGKESKDSMYIIYLNTEEVTYEIRNMVSGRKYKGGDEINNLHVLKRHVKERLEFLGVSFSSEIRDNTSRVKGVNCGYKRETK